MVKYALNAGLKENSAHAVAGYAQQTGRVSNAAFLKYVMNGDTFCTSTHLTISAKCRIQFQLASASHYDYILCYSQAIRTYRAILRLNLFINIIKRSV